MSLTVPGRAAERLSGIGVIRAEVSGRLGAMSTAHAQMKAYYEQGKERERLAGAKGVLEFERSKEILKRRMPPAPAVVADIGGGPGRYALWLAEQGYTVQHRDLMDLHVEQLQALGNPSIRTALGDARDIDLPDASVDAVLLLGPLYHLPEVGDRIQTLKEARRIVRDGGPIFAAAISRWAPRLDGILQERLYERSPHFPSLLPEIERTGNLPPVVPSGFVGYTHRPGDLADEISQAGLQLDDLVGVEGLPLAAADMESRVGDQTAWDVLIDAARAIERVPELLGLSPHLIATATRAPS
ncbi:MAG TPA: class I SAM-dependent methyltransferase [Nocardioides sp.]|jgi:SAM-dependent methyltransferase|nr:class I SAM-dependent methyltransferase [Nocardioides sp.]